MLAAARSAPLTVEIEPSAACIADPNRMKHVHIEIQNVVLTHAVGKGLTGAAVWYSVNDSPGRRVPSSQGVYLPSGTWNFGEEVVPVSGALFLNPDQGFIVKFWVAALDPADVQPPYRMGEAFNSHDPADINSKSDNYYIAKHKDFTVEYKIWVEDSKWTGAGTTNAIPAPENLRINVLPQPPGLLPGTGMEIQK